MEESAEAFQAASLNLFAQQLVDMRNDIRELRKELISIRAAYSKPNIVVVCTIIATIVAAAIGLWGGVQLAISPLKDEISKLATREVMDYKFAQTKETEVRLEEAIAGIRSSYATKEQVEGLRTDIQKKLVK